jgi:hypothetical protein
VYNRVKNDKKVIAHRQEASPDGHDATLPCKTGLKKGHKKNLFAHCNRQEGSHAKECKQA